MSEFEFMIIVAQFFGIITAEMIDSTMWFYRSELNDLNYHKDVLWSYETSSLLECSYACLERTECYTFTVEETGNGVFMCRGHSARISGQM